MFLHVIVVTVVVTSRLRLTPGFVVEHLALVEFQVVSDVELADLVVVVVESVRDGG